MSVDVAYSTATVGDSLLLRLARKLTVADGGFTLDPRTGFEVTEGYSVAVHEGREQQLTGAVRVADVKSYAYRNADLLAQSGTAFGGWRDPETGIAYLDVSVVVATRAEAAQLARAHGQVAFYDFAAGCSVAV